MTLKLAGLAALLALLLMWPPAWRVLRNRAMATGLLVLSLAVGTLNLAGRVAWTLGQWPGRGRTP